MIFLLYIPTEINDIENTQIKHAECAIDWCMQPQSVWFFSPLIRLGTSIPLNHGEDQVGGMRALVIDSVDCLHEVLLGFRLNRASRIDIAIKAREVGAADLQADAMPGFEQVGGGPQIQVQFVD